MRFPTSPHAVLSTSPDHDQSSSTWMLLSESTSTPTPTTELPATPRVLQYEPYHGDGGDGPFSLFGSNTGSLTGLTGPSATAAASVPTVSATAAVPVPPLVSAAAAALATPAVPVPTAAAASAAPVALSGLPKLRTSQRTATLAAKHMLEMPSHCPFKKLPAGRGFVHLGTMFGDERQPVCVQIQGQRVRSLPIPVHRTPTPSSTQAAPRLKYTFGEKTAVRAPAHELFAT